MHLVPLVVLAAISSPLAFAAPVPPPTILQADPTLSTHYTSSSTRSFKDVVSWVCDLPHMNRFCGKARSYIVSRGPAPPANAYPQQVVQMPIGKVVGIDLGRVTRYSLPYAQPPTGQARFKSPIPVSQWNYVRNATALPPACPQDALLAGRTSLEEDCLYMNVYVPNSSAAIKSLPVFVWLHGGSFVAGSASDAEIDGSTLAVEGNMVVITVQYRLGVFGFLRQPSLGINGNMAVLDVVQALTFIKSNIASLGGNPNVITLAGHSSGASLVKTLLTTPSADLLFNRAILQSAPLNYGDQQPKTGDALGASFLSSIQCTDIACLQSKKVDDLLKAQTTVFQSAPYEIPGVSPSEPFRPIVDGVTVAQPFISAVNNGQMKNTNRQIIFSTVKNEAGPTIAAITGDQRVATAEYQDYIIAFTDGRGEKIIKSGLYPPQKGDDDMVRNKLERLSTDWIWRCANQQSAVNMTMHAHFGNVYLAEFDVGIPYPSNVGLNFCRGKVCHQDDIEAVFSTGQNLTPAQEALEKEVITRWSAFARTGSPNSSPYATWNSIKPKKGGAAPSLNMLVLNGETSSIVQEQMPKQCGVGGFWGRIALFDEQIYV